MLGSIGGTVNVSDDDCGGEECEEELFHLILTCNIVLVSVEGTWNRVHVMCPSMQFYERCTLTRTLHNCLVLINALLYNCRIFGVFLYNEYIRPYFPWHV